MNNKRFSPARQVALVGICAAITECGKLVLAPLPNIEVVTLLTALFSYVFGITGLISTFIFVISETLIWGFGTWVPSYFIYWPLLSALFVFFGRVGLRKRWILTASALLMTALFGVISSLVEVGLFSGRFDNFFYRFGIYYVRGIPFYAAMFITNLVLFPTLFLYFTSKLKTIKGRFIG